MMHVLGEAQIKIVSGGWEDTRYDFFDGSINGGLPDIDTRSWGLLPFSGDADDGEGIVVIGASNNGGDYCGSGWTSFVPDRLHGVNISSACMMHDLRYSSSSDYSRAEADYLFLLDIYGLLRDGGVSDLAARDAAGIYYIGVRQNGGSHYQGTGSPG